MVIYLNKYHVPRLPGGKKMTQIDGVGIESNMYMKELCI